MARSAASARTVKLIFENSRVDFMVVICVVVIVVIALLRRDSTTFMKQRSRKNFSASLFGSVYSCPTQFFIRRRRPNPSVNCPVRVQIKMLDGPLTGIRQVVNPYIISRLEESGIYAKPVRPKLRTFVPVKNHRCTRLQWRDGQTTRVSINRLHNSIECRSVRILERAVCAAL